jgi:hypothetical protein
LSTYRFSRLQWAFIFREGRLSPNDQELARSSVNLDDSVAYRLIFAAASMIVVASFPHIRAFIAIVVAEGESLTVTTRVNSG